MYLKIGEHPEAKHFIPVDLDKQKFINYCIWADDETGEYEVYWTNSKGVVEIAHDDLHRPIHVLCTVKRKGNIRLIDARSDEYEKLKALMQ